MKNTILRRTLLASAAAGTAVLTMTLGAANAHADTPPPYSYQGHVGNQYMADTLSCRAQLSTNLGWHGDYVQGSWALYTHNWYPHTWCEGYTIRSTDGRNWTRVSGIHNVTNWQNEPVTYREWDGPGYLMESCVIEWHGSTLFQSLCTTPW